MEKTFNIYCDESCHIEHDHKKSYVISKDGKPGPMTIKLYNKLLNIQYGIEPDIHGWTRVVIG